MKKLRANIVKARAWLDEHRNKYKWIFVLLILVSILSATWTISTLPDWFGWLSDTPTVTPTDTPTDTPTVTPTLTTAIFTTTLRIPAIAFERYDDYFRFLLAARSTLGDFYTVTGEIEVEYPIKMSPNSSDSVTAKLYVPAKPTLAGSSEGSRITPRLASESSDIGELHLFQETIPLDNLARVKLFSPGLDIANLYPSTQLVNTHKSSFWAWTIKAPNALGRQVLTISIYLGGNASPCWTGIMTVEVVELPPAPLPAIPQTSTPTPTNTPTPTPTSTPTPTPTPIPPLTKVANQFIDNAATIFGVILTAVVSLVGIYATYQSNKRQSDTKELKAQLEKISQENAKHQELEQEIARLKSVKWWQFWR